MNITERMLLEGTMENRGVSSPKSAIRRAYLRTLVEEGTLPTRQEKPVKAVFTPARRKRKGEGQGKEKKDKMGQRRKMVICPKFVIS